MKILVTAGNTLALIDKVRCITNIAMFRIFWRTSTGWGLSLLSAALMKIDQS